MYTDSITRKELAGFMDHTLLKPDATCADIERLCAEAAQLGTLAVCVNSSMVETAAAALNGSDVRVASVVGFPLGTALSAAKARETELALRHGATEIDTVIQIGWLRERNYRGVAQDIAAVVEVAGDALVKVIIETCLLTDEEKRVACAIAVSAGAGFVKTSTGFSKAGATENDVRLMREVVGPLIGVKAAGGIRDLHTAIAMLNAGATRLGVSASAAILAEAQE
ncbi:MAG: deoxyribose-phosphate aldolase [Caldiserica bacterium]|jgi:deoxyribose-phosphate aldolase|nr:deoxyribose-phosphate aldolase [Caldisericota bacterium]